MFLTEQGHENAERILSQPGADPENASLYDPASISLVHHLYAALRYDPVPSRPSTTWCRRRDLVIVDGFTKGPLDGRPPLERGSAPGRRGQGGRCRSRPRTRRWPRSFPEPLPSLRQARRHDRHGRHQTYEVPGDLRTRTVVIRPTSRAAATTSSTVLYRDHAREVTPLASIPRVATSAASFYWQLGTTSIENSEDH